MDGKESTIPPGVYSLDDLKQYGRDRNWCPYFLSRFAVKELVSVMEYFHLCNFVDQLCKYCSLQLPLFIRSKDSRCSFKRVVQRGCGYI